jgi:hypothetical protein
MKPGSSRHNSRKLRAVGRGEFASMIMGNDPQVAEYRECFELLLEDALPASRSIELIREVAEDML